MHIFQKSFFLALAMLLIGAGSASATITTNWASGSTDASNLESSFLSTYNALTEDFEDFTVNSTPTLDLAVGTLTGGGYVSDNDGVQNTYNEYAVSGSNFYSNGTVGTTGSKSSFTITFDTAQNALGFYAIDWHDNGGQVILSLGEDVSETINIWDLIGNQSSGSLIYITLFSDIAFDSVTFLSSGNDGYAIDDISVASTPIPAAILLLGSGLIGLVGIRRRMDA